MSNVDINVDRRTDGLTDGLTDGRTDGWTDGQKIGRLYRTLLQAGAIKSTLSGVMSYAKQNPLNSKQTCLYSFNCWLWSCLIWLCYMQQICRLPNMEVNMQNIFWLADRYREVNIYCFTIFQVCPKCINIAVGISVYKFISSTHCSAIFCYIRIVYIYVSSFIFHIHISLIYMLL